MIFLDMGTEVQLTWWIRTEAQDYLPLQHLIEAPMSGEIQIRAIQVETAELAQ
jgi:hypothetical protein